MSNRSNIDSDNGHGLLRLDPVHRWRVFWPEKCLVSVVLVILVSGFPRIFLFHKFCGHYWSRDRVHQDSTKCKIYFRNIFDWSSFFDSRKLERGNGRFLFRDGRGIFYWRESFFVRVGAINFKNERSKLNSFLIPFPNDLFAFPSNFD